MEIHQNTNILPGEGTSLLFKIRIVGRFKNKRLYPDICETFILAVTTMTLHMTVQLAQRRYVHVWFRLSVFMLSPKQFSSSFSHHILIS